MSNLPVYPMGSPPPSPDQARALVDAQQAALAAVYTDLIGGMYDGVDAQSRAVGAVGSTLARSLAARVAGQSRQLAAPVGALGQSLVSSLEAQRALLAPAQAAAAQAPAPVGRAAAAPIAPRYDPADDPNAPLPWAVWLQCGPPATVDLVMGRDSATMQAHYVRGDRAVGHFTGTHSQAQQYVEDNRADWIRDMCGPGAPGTHPPVPVAPPGPTVPGLPPAPGTAGVTPPTGPPGAPATGGLTPGWPPVPGYSSIFDGSPCNPHAPGAEATCLFIGTQTPVPPIPGGGPPAPPPVTPGAPVPPAPPPAPVPVTLPKPLDCTILLPVGFAGGIPLPGSPEWCDGFDDTRKLFIDIGNAVIRWAIGTGGDDLLSQANASVKGQAQSPAGGIGAIGGVVLGLTPGLPEEMIRQTIQCWAQALKTAGLCEVGGLLALGALKALLGLLGNVRFGWDLFIWFTVDLHLPMHAFDTVIDQFLASMCPDEIPSVGEALECYLLGTAPESQVRCWMLMRGASLDVWAPVLKARREKLTPEESIEWDRRNDVPEEDTLDRLRQLGMLDVAERQARLDLYDELPTIQDHLHWLQRNVFDDAYVADYNLMEGFDDRFWTKFGHDLRAQGMRKEYAGLHYAAHWIQPAPGQLAEMLQRLRPGRVSPDVQFTEQDYLRLLAEQDVAPYFRARMRAVAYVPFGLRFLRQIYDTFGISDAELRERLQDLGYSPTDSDVLGVSESVRRARTRATTARGWNMARAVAGVRSGLLTPDEGFARLAGQGWTQQEWADALSAADVDARGKVQLHAEAAAQKAALASVLGCYADGVCSRDQAEQALVAQGWTRDLAAVRLEALDLEARRKLVREGVGAVRAAYRAGRLDAGAALVQLQQLGLQPGRAAAQVSVWEARQTDHRKLLTGAQITRAVEHGLLSVPDARARLATLGYADPDALLLLREADIEIRKSAAKALASADKLRAQQIRAQEKAVQAATALREKAQAKLKRLTPLSKLMKWLSRGIASEGYVRDRMTAMGYPPDVIDDYIREAGLPPKKSVKSQSANGQAGTPPQAAPGP